jgi:AcrR family transcriptional regulator
MGSAGLRQAVVYHNVRVSSYSAVQPKIPRQERGERRVAELLEAAEAVMSEIGYEAATMSAIADRAGAAIGSLYQFFPNKACITQALRTEYAKRFDRMFAPLAMKARALNPEALASRLVDLTVEFAEAHPALPALLDAPKSTRAPLPMQKILRERFARVLLARGQRLSKAEAARAGTATLHILKALNQLYTELLGRERHRMVDEFKMVLLGYFRARLRSQKKRRSRQ